MSFGTVLIVIVRLILCGIVFTTTLSCASHNVLMSMGARRIFSRGWGAFLLKKVNNLFFFVAIKNRCCL